MAVRSVSVPRQCRRHLRRVSTVKFDDEQFEALFNELQTRGDREKLKQLFGA
jgi:hypothetical protein